MVMSCQLPPPPHFPVYSSIYDAACRCNVWFPAFKLYLSAGGISDDPQQRDLLQYIGGPDIQQVVRGLSNTGTDLDTLEKAISDFFASKTASSLSRYQFRQITQQLGEHNDVWYARLCQQADLCAFGGNKDSAILDQLVAGCSSRSLWRALLQVEALDLEKAIAKACSFEAAEVQDSLLAAAATDCLHACATAGRGYWHCSSVLTSSTLRTGLGNCSSYICLCHHFRDVIPSSSHTQIPLPLWHGNLSAMPIAAKLPMNTVMPRPANLWYQDLQCCVETRSHLPNLPLRGYQILGSSLQPKVMRSLSSKVRTQSHGTWCLSSQFNQHQSLDLLRHLHESPIKQQQVHQKSSHQQHQHSLNVLIRALLRHHPSMVVSYRTIVYTYVKGNTPVSA